MTQHQCVAINSSVTVIEQGSEDEEVYQVVENSRADLLQNKIPADNPLAQALLGKQPGDEVSIDGPNGQVKLSVVEVEST